MVFLLQWYHKNFPKKNAGWSYAKSRSISICIKGMQANNQRMSPLPSIHLLFISLTRLHSFSINDPPLVQDFLIESLFSFSNSSCFICFYFFGWFMPLAALGSKLILKLLFIAQTRELDEQTTPNLFSRIFTIRNSLPSEVLSPSRNRKVFYFYFQQRQRLLACKYLNSLGHRVA